MLILELGFRFRFFGHGFHVLIKMFFCEYRYNAYQAYGQSKTGDILLARMIGQQLKVWINHHLLHRGPV